MTELVIDIPNDIAKEMKRARFINLRGTVESILARSKLKEKDVEEIDNIIKHGTFEKYYKTKISS